MDAKIRAAIAELVGTYLVVVIGAGTICATYLIDTTPGTRVLAAALAQGFVLAAVVTMTSHLSPVCCNPALTLTLWVTHRIELGQALWLGAAQFVGSFFAGLSLLMIFAPSVLLEARLGTPHLAAFGPPTLASLSSGVCLEALFTFLMTITVYASLLDPHATKLGGLYVGLAQAAVVLFGFHLTGGAANPARWFGPALWQLALADAANPLGEHAVYWAGPVTGAIAGCVFYSMVVRPPRTK